MSRKQTKAQQILDEARMRVRAAEIAFSNAQQKVAVAQAELNAHRDVYQALDLSLAPKPREKKAEPEQKALPGGTTKIPHGGRNRKDGTDGKGSSEEGGSAAASNDG